MQSRGDRVAPVPTPASATPDAVAEVCFPLTASRVTVDSPVQLVSFGHSACKAFVKMAVKNVCHAECAVARFAAPEVCRVTFQTSPAVPGPDALCKKIVTIL
jgi:hypothetical protein